MEATATLRFSGTIAKELNELKDVLSCYKHFEASYEGSLNPVAKVQVQLNKIIIRKSIQELEDELLQVYAAAREAGREQPKQDVIGDFRMNFNKYIATPLEETAIEHFRTDKRYTITE